MMLKKWISAFRPRTLPLALSTVLMGNAIAIHQGKFNIIIFGLTILTTLCLQILSNLANDYGDGIKGTDNENRLGPKRALQSGDITIKQMKTSIIIFSLLSLLFGLGLLFYSLAINYLLLFFVLIGIAAIFAAIKYTVGKTAYGYHGLGDVFVFIFFGIVGVIGSYFLQTLTLNISVLWPAIAIGCLSTAVLNLNNMRDIKNDKAMNKNTLVVKIGLQKAKLYHYALFVIAYTSLVYYIFSQTSNYLKVIILGVTLGLGIFLIIQLKTVKSAKNYQAFDPLLKVVALVSFILSLSWYIIFLL